MKVVVDASVAVAWCLGEPEARHLADSVLRMLEAGEAVVPSIWPSEVANALLVKERQRRLRAEDTKLLLELMARLPIVVDSVDSNETFSRIAELARKWTLSVYDASYLDLSLRLSLPLASLDGPLRGASEKAGAHLFSG